MHTRHFLWIGRNKFVLSGVFVESDWPEYESTFNAIETRVKREQETQAELDSYGPGA